MKKKTSLYVAIAFFALAILSACGMWTAANAETVTWDNPTVFEDGASMTAADIAALGTVIEIKGAGETDAWEILATVANGANTWTGPLPVKCPKGSIVSLRAKSTLHGLDSAYCDAVSYPIPYVAPKSPSNMIIISVTTSR